MNVPELHPGVVHEFWFMSQSLIYDQYFSNSIVVPDYKVMPEECCTRLIN